MPQPLADELKSIPMSSNLGQSLERAHAFARAQSHRAVTLEHLLLALTEDPEAALILQAANVDLARLSTEVSGYLGGLLEDMRGPAGSEPRPDADLLRVLQAAASAAQQSRRRQIDGAIVLAAVVGDAKSPAAGMLKSLGMTFEEAIRALQRANTKARLQPKAAGPQSRYEDGAPPATAEVPVGPPLAASPAAVPPAAAPPSAATQPAAATLPAAQTAEEILAAARARIHQRSVARAQPETPARPPPAPAADPTPAPRPAVVTPEREPAVESLSSAIEAAMEAPVVRRVEPGSRPAPRPPPVASAPPPPAEERPLRPAWAPAGAPAEGRVPSAPPRMPMPAVPPPSDIPRPPPPPARANPSLPMPRQQGRARSDAAPPPGRQAGAGNGEIAALKRLPGSLPGPLPGPHPGPLPGPHPGPPMARPPEPPRMRHSQRGGAERGPLVESIPRRMRARVAVRGEVRIARDKVDALMHALAGASPQRPGAQLARTLCVRLRAPNGGFAIEALTPETQWIENSGTSIVHDDSALWRWKIVPLRSGRGRLLLMLSARTIGAEAIGPESAPPDRVIDVRIRRNYARFIVRLLAWIGAIAVGVLLGRYSDQALGAASLLLQQIQQQMLLR